MTGTEVAQQNEIPVNQIFPNPRQPRTVFDETALNELIASIKSTGIEVKPAAFAARKRRTVFDETALNELIASIKSIGILQPPVVRKVADNKYELIMGERRFRAAKAAGLIEAMSSLSAVSSKTVRG